MSWSHRLAEEGDQVFVLQQDGVEAVGGGIALDHEGVVELESSARTRAIVMAVFKALNTSVASLDHKNPSLSRALRGTATVP